MLAYLTPTRYRNMGMGISLTGRTDAMLWSDIQAASAFVNSYCCVPVGHDFRGGTVTGEEHIWDTGNVKRSPSNRVWPYHRPVKTVASLDIVITNNQSISWSDSASLFLHPTEGWVEPVDLALTQFGVFGYGILPNIGLRQPVARISYTYGWEFAVTGEQLTALAGATTLYAANQWWTADDVTLTKNGSLIVPTSIDRNEGSVVVPAVNGTDVYALSYTHKLPESIARATAMIVTELIGMSAIASSGLVGLESIKVKEVELRQGRMVHAGGASMSMAAQMLLQPFVVRSIA